MVTGTTTKIHTKYFDFLPKFKKEAEVFEKERLTGWRMEGGIRRGNKKVEESWPYHSSDPAKEMSYKNFMDQILDKSGKYFNQAKDQRGVPMKNTGASHVITDIIRLKTKDGKEVLYTKGRISGYNSMGDLVSFYCPKPEVWTRTLFGHKRGWDEDEQMIITKTTGPEGSETVYDLPFNEKNLKELFNQRKSDEINFVIKEELGGEARQVKDINCYKTMELFQKPFDYLWNADYLSPQSKLEARQRAIDKGLISPIRVQGLDQQQTTKPPAGTYS